MHISIISSSMYPASPEVYGGEAMNSILASELSRRGHLVRLFAPPQSTHFGSTELIPIPCTHGTLSYESERLVYEDQEYREIILDSDYIIDYSSLCYTAEALYFWERDRLYHDLTPVYSRNGMLFGIPRYPSWRYLHGTALSNAARDEAIKAGLPPDFIHIVPCGIDLNMYKPSRVSTEDYILYIGRCHPHKGVHRIIKLAERMPDENFKLAWRAVSPEHQQYERIFRDQVKRKEIRNVHFQTLTEGRELQEKIRLYRRARAFITPHPSAFNEAFGLTLAEAMSCGTPVITSRHGSAPEVVRNGITGYCCETLEEYSEAIKRIDEIQPRRCREWIRHNFTRERMADEYLKLYETISTSKQ